MKWINCSERFPDKKATYFLRHKYEDGRWHWWWAYVVPEAIDKDYWLKMGYEYLDETEQPIPSDIANDTSISKIEIIKRHIPNGIVNVKGKGDGKPQYKAEIAIIEKCMEEYAYSLLSDKIETLNKIIELKESERKEWADLCIKKQARIDELEPPF